MANFLFQKQHAHLYTLKYSIHYQYFLSLYKSENLRCSWLFNFHLKTVWLGSVRNFWVVRFSFKKGGVFFTFWQCKHAHFSEFLFRKKTSKIPQYICIYLHFSIYRTQYFYFAFLTALFCFEKFCLLYSKPWNEFKWGNTIVISLK